MGLAVAMIWAFGPFCLIVVGPVPLLQLNIEDDTTESRKKIRLEGVHFQFQV
jgi:hypothetical protein